MTGLLRRTPHPTPPRIRIARFPFGNDDRATFAVSSGTGHGRGPSDVDDGASLKALLGRYATRGPVTVCLEPGTYTLPTPLVLGSQFDGITLQACREGVVLQAPSQPGAEFVLGLIVMQGVSSVTIRGIELSVPLAGNSWRWRRCVCCWRAPPAWARRGRSAGRSRRLRRLPHRRWSHSRPGNGWSMPRSGTSS